MALETSSSRIASLSNSVSGLGLGGVGIHAGWAKFRGSAWYTSLKNSCATSCGKSGVMPLLVV